MTRINSLWNKLAIALILGLVLAGQVSAQVKYGPATEPFLKIFTSGTYHMKATMSGGGISSDMEVFTKGGRISTVISSKGEKSRIIIRDNKSYMINDTLKMIMVSPIQDTSGSGVVDTDNHTFSGKGTASFAGKNLPYEEYATDDGKARYFVDGNKLAGIRNIIPGEGEMDIVISVLDQNVPDSAFAIPTSGYEVLDMSSFRF